MIFLVIVLHSAITFSPLLESIWIVSDPDNNNGLGLLVIYLDIFVMFILFFISGYFIPSSMKSKNSWGVIKSKFNRIMIPWIVAVFTLIPAYKYIFLYSRGLPQEEWFTYFHLYHQAGANNEFFADYPSQSWLWFLPVLFLFQVLYVLLRKTNILKIKISLKTAVLLTFLAGLIYSMVIAIMGFKGWFDSPILHFQRERILIYFLFFLLGSLCYKLKVFESNHKNKRLYIISNIILSVSISIFTIVTLNFFQNIMEPGRNYFFFSELIDGMMYYATVLISVFCFLYIFIYLFRFRISRSNILLSELSKNSYFVYIIHMIVIGGLSLLLLNIPLPALLKFVILVILTFTVSNILVSAYRAVIQKSLSNKILKNAVLPTAIILSIAIYAQQENEIPVQQQLNTSQDVPLISIHMAALQGDLDAIHQHIAAGTDLNKTEPSAGSTPIITASLFGKTDVVKVLIEGGADVNFRNKEGSTALHTAAFFCRPLIVRELLDHGADMSIRNNAGSTAIESVMVPFEAVKGYYDYFGNTLGPLGLELDYEYIETTRPKIVNMLQGNAVK